VLKRSKEASASTVCPSSNTRPLVIGCQGREKEIGIVSLKLFHKKKKPIYIYISQLNFTFLAWMAFPALVLTSKNRSIWSRLLTCRRPLFNSNNLLPNCKAFQLP